MGSIINVLLISSFIVLSNSEIDAELLKVLSSGGSRSDILINFNGGNSEAIKSVEAATFSTRTAKVEALTTALRRLRDKDQGSVEKFLTLNGNGVEIKSFWVSNQMVLKNANLNLLQAIDVFPTVGRIQKLPVIKLFTEMESESDNNTIANDDGIKADNVEWGVRKIGANQLWFDSKGKISIQGQDVVVANIDTGVRVTHEALKSNFRELHGWFDPYPTKSKTPDDKNGHGTHTMGIIVGKGGIGVAPKAKWIACRGCNTDTCVGDMLLACGQFMLSPTEPDGETDPQAKLIPDIVSISWVNEPNMDNFYQDIIIAWKKAGIWPVFAIGNKQSCRSTGSPGNQPGVFSVGSTDSSDKLSDLSSRGPSPSNGIKPDISAPGSRIRSAWHSGDRSYQVGSGTSLATPHVAGTMALMLCKYRKKHGKKARLSQKRVVEILKETAVTKGLGMPANSPKCGNDFPAIPSNQFGYGRIDALAATIKIGER